MPESIDHQVALIRKLILAKSYKNALSESDLALKRFLGAEDQVRILRERAHTYACMSLYDEAFNDIEKVTESDFFTIEDFFYASLHLIRIGKYESACKFGCKGIEVCVQTGEKYYLDSLYFNQAYSCTRLRKADEARSYLQHIDCDQKYWVDDFEMPYTKQYLESMLEKLDIH